MEKFWDAYIAFVKAAIAAKDKVEAAAKEVAAKVDEVGVKVGGKDGKPNPSVGSHLK